MGSHTLYAEQVYLFYLPSMGKCYPYLVLVRCIPLMASHAGVFGGARISYDEIRAPLKAPAWETTLLTALNGKSF